MGAGPSASFQVPKTMKAVHVKRFLPAGTKNADTIRDCLEIAEVPVPLPDKDQLLVRVEYSPINPADITIASGNYGGAVTSKSVSKQIVPGTEGSGTIVKVGKGIPSAAVGHRVTFYANGAWAEYVLVEKIQCVPLPKDVSFEEGCNCFANPVSVVAFIQLAKAEGHRCIVHTAAASALGKMLIAYGKEQGVGVVGVVRKPEQAKEVMDAGARACLVMSDEDINNAIQLAKEESQHEEHKSDAAAAAEAKRSPYHQLEDTLKEHKVTLGFDAVAGPLTGVLLKAMQPKAIIYVYGGLSNQPSSFIRPTDLIFYQKQVRGFWAIAFVKNKRPNDQKILANQVLACVRKGQSLNTVIKSEFALAQGVEAIITYLNDMSGGKVVITPGKDRAAAAAATPAAEAKPAAAAEAETKKEEEAPAAASS